MSVAKQLNPISVEDYLAGELISPMKHEYVAGAVYAMTGARTLHNIISGNAFAAFHARLRGKRCRPFHSDMKVRILFPTHTRFYYPDASVVCRLGAPTDSFQDAPAVVVEVLSRSTRRIDEGEKKDAYFTIPSLAAYLLVEQDGPLVTVHRRTEHGFVCELYQGLDAVIPLPEVEIELPLHDLYEAVEFTAEPEPTDGA